MIRKAVVVEDNTPTIDSTTSLKTKKTIFRFYQVVWYILGTIELLLAFRFALKLLAANPYSYFTNFIYSLSYPLVLPFEGILRTPYITNGYIFEWSTLIAMAVYLVVAYLIVELLQLIKPVSPEEVEEGINEE